MVIAHFKSKNKISILCCSCFDDITNSDRVRCIECNIDECVKCFLISVTNNDHYMHTFRAIEYEYLKSDTEWKVLDEFLFFEGLKLFGIGNFADIAYFMSKTEEEVRTHFYNIFHIKERKLEQIKIPKYSNPNFHKVWSYMPLRSDFENQYREDYEKIIKDVKLDEGDSEFLIKKQMLEAYRTIILIRKRRETFVISRNLFEMSELIEKENKIEPTKRKILKQIKPITQFLSKKDFNIFLEGLYIEKKAEENLFIKRPLLGKKEEIFLKNANFTPKNYLKLKRMIIKCALKKKKLNFKKLYEKFYLNDIEYKEIIETFGLRYFEA